MKFFCLTRKSAPLALGTEAIGLSELKSSLPCSSPRLQQTIIPFLTTGGKYQSHTVLCKGSLYFSFIVGRLFLWFFFPFAASDINPIKTFYFAPVSTYQLKSAASPGPPSQGPHRSHDEGKSCYSEIYQRKISFSR